MHFCKSQIFNWNMCVAATDELQRGIQERGGSDNLGLKHPLKKSHFIVFVFNWCSWDFIHNMYICLNVKDLLANTGKMCFSYVESNSG